MASHSLSISIPCVRPDAIEGSNPAQGIKAKIGTVIGIGRREVLKGTGGFYGDELF